MLTGEGKTICVFNKSINIKDGPTVTFCDFRFGFLGLGAINHWSAAVDQKRARECGEV
jgi:hypothetical protein